MIQSEFRQNTKKFKHSKHVPFKDRAEVMKFLKGKSGNVYSPYLDSEKTSFYYVVPDNRCKYGVRHIATYEKEKLRW